jgi:hypothetical protein
MPEFPDADQLADVFQLGTAVGPVERMGTGWGGHIVLWRLTTTSGHWATKQVRRDPGSDAGGQLPTSVVRILPVSASTVGCCTKSSVLARHVGRIRGAELATRGANSSNRQRRFTRNGLQGPEEPVGVLGALAGRQHRKGVRGSTGELPPMRQVRALDLVAAAA